MKGKSQGPTKFVSGCIILPCNCSNEFQDEKYGKGLRVHNKSDRQIRARCTVCGNLKQITEKQWHS